MDTYQVSGISPDMSFLEMLYVLEEQLNSGDAGAGQLLQDGAFSLPRPFVPCR